MSQNQVQTCASPCVDDPFPSQASGDPIPRLAKARLHEIHAATEDWPSALAFALAAIEAEGAQPILLVRARRKGKVAMVPCAAGWQALGIDPARLLIVDAPDDAALLRAALDATREGGLAAVVLETWGTTRAYDLVASRRLILAAEGSGMPVVVLRGDADPRASAAHTRWTVAAAPSVPLEARAPGPPALLVELVRRRGGPAGLRWRLEWNDDHGRFDERPAAEQEPGKEPAPPSGAVVPLPLVRTRAPLRRTA